MSNEQLIAVITRALLNGLQRHATANYGVVVDVPPVAVRGEYAKMTGYFMLTDVAMDIAAAVEAAQESKP